MKATSYTYEYVEFTNLEHKDIFGLLLSEGLSQRYITYAYKSNLIRVNDVYPGPNGLISPDDKIKIFYEDECEDHEILEEDPEIIFENENYLIVNKPANLVVHPTFSNRDETLWDLIGSYFKKKKIDRKVRLINRLDSETSGLIMIAKNPIFQQQVSKQMEELTVNKTYIAIVEGKIKIPGQIESGITENKAVSMRRLIDQDGKLAITKYKPILSNDKYSLVELQPITGRTHQLRLHMQSIGHSIIGDYLYGTRSEIINRTALHSSQISFLDPFSNKKVTYKAKLPEDIDLVLKNFF